jgi:hypothetical protein
MNICFPYNILILASPVGYLAHPHPTHISHEILLPILKYLILVSCIIFGEISIFRKDLTKKIIKCEVKLIKSKCILDQ